MMKLLRFTIPGFFALLLMGSHSCTTNEMLIEKTDEGVWIKEGDAPVLFYQTKTKTLNGEYPRADYVHPLYDLNGAVITEDFPEDHHHHRGIFWTWHQVWIGNERIADAWLCEDFIWDVKSIETSAGNNAQLNARVNWKSPNFKNGTEPFANEILTITAYPLKNNKYRMVDFKIEISSLVDSLRIGGSENEKGYGGFSTRIKLPDDLKFTSGNNPVEPKTNPVEAGPWMNMNATFNGENKSGFVIIQHPKNPGYVEPWILRSKKSMQNPVYPGREAILLQKAHPLVLQYRIVMYNGESSNFNPEDVFFE